MQIKQIEPAEPGFELFDVAVIGGGIVGLMTLLKLTAEVPGLKSVLVEKEPQIAAHQTGHNSGVIHTGIYYRPGTEKARLSVSGSRMMKAFCSTYGVPHSVCGKLIVATDRKEIPRLDELFRRGMENGVPDLRRLSGSEVSSIEPHTDCLAGIHVPGAAVVDYRSVSNVVAELIRSRGGQIRLGFHVTSIQRVNGKYSLQSPKGEIQSRYLVTCGGLFSDRLAAAAGISEVPRIVPFRGEYFRLKAAATHLVKTMIYPVPDPRFPFLGVHLTRGVDGIVEAGPNAVLAFKREGYKKTDFSMRDTWETVTYPGFLRMAGRHWRTGLAEMARSYNKNRFTKSLQRLVPEIQCSDLETGGSGVRAQALLRTGQLLDDFHIVEGDHALFVCNAPSPAATASIAIGERIAEKLTRLMKN